jgi:hypothetical protein
MSNAVTGIRIRLWVKDSPIGSHFDAPISSDTVRALTCGQ